MTDLTVYREQSPAVELVAWADAARAAHALATSLVTTNVCPDAFRHKPEEATAVILLGAEVGMSPITALRSMFVIRGTVGMYVRAQVALVQSRGHRIWTETETDERVVVAGHRAGDPDHVERCEWTIARARRAGFIRRGRGGEPSQYETQPATMLYARAAGEVCRRIAADVLAGIPEGLDDEPSDAHAPTGVTRVARRRTEPNPVAGELSATGDQPTGTATGPGADDATPFWAPQNDEVPEETHSEVSRAASPEETPSPDDDAEPQITEAQRGAMHVHMRALGMVDHNERVNYVTDVIGRAIGSTTEITVTEASVVLDHLAADLDERRESRRD